MVVKAVKLEQTDRQTFFQIFKITYVYSFLFIYDTNCIFIRIRNLFLFPSFNYAGEIVLIALFSL